NAVAGIKGEYPLVLGQIGNIDDLRTDRARTHRQLAGHAGGRVSKLKGFAAVHALFRGGFLRVSNTSAVRREHSSAIHARALESRRYARTERVVANRGAAMLAARIEKQSSMHAVEQFHSGEFTSSRLCANSCAARVSGRAIGSAGDGGSGVLL